MLRKERLYSEQLFRRVTHIAVDGYFSFPLSFSPSQFLKIDFICLCSLLVYMPKIHNRIQAHFELAILSHFSNAGIRLM